MAEIDRDSSRSILRIFVVTLELFDDVYCVPLGVVRYSAEVFQNATRDDEHRGKPRFTHHFVLFGVWTWENGQLRGAGGAWHSVGAQGGSLFPSRVFQENQSGGQLLLSHSSAGGRGVEGEKRCVARQGGKLLGYMRYHETMPRNHQNDAL